MRAMIWGVLVLAGLWGGYWLAGSTAVKQGTEDWFVQAASQGLQAENGGVSVAGFPNVFNLTVTAPDVFDPVSGFGWRTDTASLYTMTWKPWHLIAILPAPQVVTTPEGEVSVTSTKLRASVILHPGTDLALDRTVIEATDLAFSGPAGQMQIAAASFATQEDTSRRHSHRIGVQITGLTPDPAVSAALPDLPAVMAGAHLDMILLLSAPLDRHAGKVQPQPTGLIVNDISLDWGPLQVTASGSIAAASEGVAEGRLDIRIEAWRLLPDVLAQSGAMDPVLAPTLLRAFEIMSEGGADVLEVPLIFKSGQMRLGALPLGPAPRIAYRQ